jgi:arylsulfatase B
MPQAPSRFLDNGSFPCPLGGGLCKAGANTSACLHCTVQTIMAMAAAMDEAVGNLTRALKSEGLWGQALVIFFADNGGQSHLFGQDGGNNYPLRGGKDTDLEGGVRTVAFIAGGVVPVAAQGSQSDILLHACDWYAVIAGRAGLPLDRNGLVASSAAAADGTVPPLDAIDVWSSLIDPRTPSPGPRRELLLSSNSSQGGKGALIVWPHKFIVKQTNDHNGGKNDPNLWASVNYPVGPYELGVDLHDAVFDILSDESERDDLGQSQPALAKQLKARFVALSQTQWQTGDDGYMGGYTQCVTLGAYVASHSNFVGPLCTKPH